MPYPLRIMSQWVDAEGPQSPIFFFGCTDPYFVFIYSIYIYIISITRRHTLIMFTTLSPGKVGSWNLKFSLWNEQKQPWKLWGNIGAYTSYLSKLEDVSQLKSGQWSIHQKLAKPSKPWPTLGTQSPSENGNGHPNHPLTFGEPGSLGQVHIV